jgi:hypothetical protein
MLNGSDQTEPAVAAAQTGRAAEFSIQALPMADGQYGAKKIP